MFIYVVNQGEDYEGEETIGAFSSKEQALEFALSQPIDRGEWSKYQKQENDYWFEKYGSQYEYYLTNNPKGSSYIKIKKFEIKE